jgi:hypothetical protein
MVARNSSETVATVTGVEAEETGQASAALGELVQRGQAAKLAGVSRSTLWRLQHEGVLRPTVVSAQGWALFRLQDVLALRRARPDALASAMVVPGPEAPEEGAPLPMPHAELCAQVFDLFEAGHDGASVVRTLRTVSPDQVLALRDKWTQLKGAGVLVSPRSVQQLVSTGLAIPRENEQGERSASTIQDEAMLLEAIARALDTRQGLSGQRATSAADVARWLSARVVAGAAGVLVLSAQIHDCSGERTVKSFRCEEWSSAEALGRAVFDEAMHEQRKQEDLGLKLIGAGGEPMFNTGSYALRLETPHGVHRYWLSLETVAVGELARSLRESTDALRGRLVRKGLERDKEKKTENKAKRKEALEERARLRREAADERVKERARERAEDRKHDQQLEREMRAAGLLGTEPERRPGAKGDA